MNKAVAAIWAGLKATALRWGGSRWSWSAGYQGGAPYDYRHTTSTAPANAAIQAVIRWICRTVPEAPLVVQTRAADGTLTPVPEHALLQLLARPNPFYSGLQLWTGALADLELTGNAYWVKIRSGGARGRVVELWWVPAAQLEPRWPDDGTPPFISHYEYSVQGQLVSLPVSDVIHFRLGFDPGNIRKGLSPLMGLLREIATDDEASLFTASILHNLGVPGVVLSPEAGISAADSDLEEIKLRFTERFGGAHRGQPLVLRGPTRVSVLSFSPEQMQLRELRRIPEERITAVYGIPAIVVGLGAGLDRSTFANFAEAREAAYESMILPLQRHLAADLEQQLLPDFADPARTRLTWDYSGVRVLQEDANAMMTRAVAGFQGGVLTRAEARQLVGQPAEPADDLFALPQTFVLSARTDGVPAPLPAPVPLRALPEAAGFPAVERKAVSTILPALTASRVALELPCERDLARYLQQQQAALLAQLVAPAKALADVALDEAATAELAALLAPYYAQLLAEAQPIVARGLGTAFTVPDPLTTQYLTAVQGHLAGITATTREAVATTLAAGQAAGEGIPQLAARLQSLGVFERSRATTIARTELANASVESAYTTYLASGVVLGIRVHDGDYDEACAARNGRVFPLAQAPGEPRLLHPRCTAAWSPIVEAAELTGAA
jgi:HK97 family phage portal protein